MAAVLLEAHAQVVGAPVASVEVRESDGAWTAAEWDRLGAIPRAPGLVDLRASVDGGGGGLALRIPVCAGRKGARLDGTPVELAPGPVVLALTPGPHRLELTLQVSVYERRIACGEPVVVGPSTPGVTGLGLVSFPSPHGAAGGGRAVVFVPQGHDVARPGPVLVGLHPWNGTMWTYAAYAQLVREAAARDVVLLMPSGLGNSLYTADAEDEAMRALDALGSVVAVDPQRVSLWGASMGGAGATTVGLHHPDRFAAITSFFGDSRYDLTTYVRGLLRDEAGAHRVNALDVADNARWVPVWLIHGEDDVVSPIRQSVMLAQALGDLGFTVRFDRVPGMGHAGALVARFLTEVVAGAASARAPAHPPRVTYRSVRPWDTGAYGVHLTRSRAEGDAFVDVERGPGGVHVRQADGVSGLVLEPGCLGTDPEHPPAILDDIGRHVTARWASPPR